MRIAVVGLYRSGSSFWAGVLHHLGVDMGTPFWENDVPNHPDNHYESLELVETLPRIWQEPRGELLEDWDSRDVQKHLSDYIHLRNPFTGGGKHPLFCLCMDDLMAVWGGDTKVIWSQRSLNDSIDSLLRTTFPWTRLEMATIQRKLWDASHKYFREHPPTLALNLWEISAGGRRRAVEVIASKLDLKPTREQIEAAVNSFREP